MGGVNLIQLVRQRTQCRQYYQENREELLEQKKAYYWANRDRICVQQKKYREVNRDKEVARRKKYYEKRKFEKELDILGLKA